MKLKEINTPITPEAQDTSIAQNQLLKIGNHAILLNNIINSQESDPWVAKKINLASNHVKKVHNYMSEYRQTVSPRDEAHYREMMKTLQDIELQSARDPETMAEVRRRKMELKRWAEQNLKTEDQDLDERMPASIIKHKEKLAHMSDEELANRFKDKDETTLRQMAWRHGYGKMSSHYLDRVRNTKNESLPLNKNESSPLKETAKMAIELIEILKQGKDINDSIQSNLNLAADSLQAVYQYEGYRKANPYREELDSNTLNKHAQVIQNGIDGILARETPIDDVDTKPGMLRILGKKVNEVEKEMAKETRKETPYEESLQNQLDSAITEYDTPEKKAQRDALMKQYLAKGGKVEKIPTGKTAYKNKELKPAYKKDPGTPLSSPMSDESVKEDEGKDTVIMDIAPNGIMYAVIYKDEDRVAKVQSDTPQGLANELMKHGATIKNTRFSHASGVDFPEEDGGWNNKEYGLDTHGFIDDTLEWMNRLTKKQGGFDGTVRGPDESVEEEEPGYYKNPDKEFNINGLTTKQDVVQSIIDNIDNNELDTARDSLNQLLDVVTALHEAPIEQDHNNPVAKPYVDMPEWKALHDMDDKIVQAYIKHKEVKEDGPPFGSGMSLVQRALMNKWITAEEWYHLKDKWNDAADEIEQRYNDWPEGEGFGSSDHNFAIKELMGLVGYEFDEQDRGGRFIVTKVPDELEKAGITNVRMSKDARIDRGMAKQKADAETNPNWGKDIGPVATEDAGDSVPRLLGKAEASLSHGLQMAQNVIKKDYGIAEVQAKVIAENWPPLIDNIKNVYKTEDRAGDGVQPVDLKRMGRNEPKIYVHKDGKTIMVPKSKHNEYLAKGWKQSSLRAETSIMPYESKLKEMLKQRLK